MFFELSNGIIYLIRFVESSRCALRANKLNFTLDATPLLKTPKEKLV